jgi:Abnormal spindle-like microcephaly-assoc'd, ASPM-SPD-2-Hydin
MDVTLLANPHPRDPAKSITWQSTQFFLVKSTRQVFYCAAQYFTTQPLDTSDSITCNWPLRGNVRCRTLSMSFCDLFLIVRTGHTPKLTQSTHYAVTKNLRMNATPKRLKVVVTLSGAIFALAMMVGCQGISSLHTTATTTNQQTATGQLSVSPSSVTFTSVQPGASQSQTETLTNNGLSGVTVTQAPVTGAGFSMSGLSLPLMLAAGQSAKFNVAFSPISAGSATGTIAILSNASNPNLTVPLTGSATPLQGQLAVTPATLSLGSVTVGTSALATGTLSAMGSDVTIMSASSTNSRFVLSGLSLPVTIPAGKSAAFSVSFSPQTAGAATATLTFASTAYPSTTAAALTGTGTSAQGQLAITPSTLSLGSVTVGKSGTATGSLVVTGADVTLTAASSNNSRFALSGLSFPVTIQAGQSAEFTVTFSPQTSGAASGTLTFVSNANPSSIVGDLTGTGTTAEGQLAVTPTTLSLGNVAVGASGTAAGSLTASGANVTITAASSNNSRFDLSGISLPMTIQAGHSAAFNVTFSPQTTGTASATLTFVSNGVPTSITDALTGTGTTAPSHTVNLSWNPSSSSNIVGYNIYRSTFGTACGSYARLNSSLNESTSYGDSSVVDGQSYCYVTTAVNSSNEESAYSAVVRAIIPAP